MYHQLCIVHMTFRVSLQPLLEHGMGPHPSHDVESIGLEVL